MEHESAIRLGAFAAIFVTVLFAEALFPRRKRVQSRLQRWTTNISITALGAVVVRVMTLSAVPITATAAAIWASNRGFGIWHAVDWPSWLEIGATLLILDFAIWFQHILTHRIPGLWRLHRVHHSDRDFDTTNALRFHPIEIACSMLYKTVIVIALGPSVFAVIVFEIGLNGFALFNHANLHLPKRIDAALRWILVTPDVHRIHHSMHRIEHDSNYGFSITLWDRLFGTFTAQPRDGHQDMTIGLPPYQSANPAKLGWSLALPFARHPAPVPSDPSEPEVASAIRSL